MVSAADRAEITRRLHDIEQAHGIRILLAIESGSRAWDFPSQDSDFDVRFLYVHPAAHYLSVAPLRDVVELSFDPPFDIGGWDLRKAAWMLCRSNATVMEWANSPIRYVEVDGLADRLTGLADAVVNREALAYHYDRMTRRA